MKPFAYWIIVLVLITLSSGCSSTEVLVISPIQNDELTLDYIEDRTVFVNNYYGLCTGVVLSNDHDGAIVATCKHCVDNAYWLEVDDQPVIEVTESETNDLALLVTKPIPGKVAVKLSYDLPEIGETVFHVGRGATDDKDYRIDGTFEGIYEDDLYFDMKIIEGCSGGGVFNRNGELIGIAYAIQTYKDGTSSGVANSLLDIAEMIFPDETSVTSEAE